MRYFVLLLSVPVLVFATTYTTINIEGTNSGWESDEDFSISTSDGTLYFTWDADYLYLGISHSEADYGNLATFIWFDTDPLENANGSTSGYAWGQFVNLPFKADYAIVWKNESSNDYIEVRHYNGSTSTWEQVASANSTVLNSGNYYVQFAIGTDYREVRIKRSTIGSPSAIKMCSFTEQQWSSYWRYFGWPYDGWTDAARSSGQSFTHYQGYPLGENIVPDANQYHDASDASLPVTLTNFSARTLEKSIHLSWTTESEIENQGFILYRAIGNGDFNLLTSFTNCDALKGHGTTTSANHYSYLDNAVSAGSTYRYLLADIDYRGQETKHFDRIVEATFAPCALQAIYPNPFNPYTTITYSAPANSKVTFWIYDLLGHPVWNRTIIHDAAGSYRLKWDGVNQSGDKLATGMYLLKMSSAEFTTVQKLLLIR